MNTGLRDDTHGGMALQASFMVRALRTLWRQPLSYTLGRFASVRRIYGTARGIRQRLGLDPSGTEAAAVLHGLDANVAAQSLRMQSFAIVPPLPMDVVTEIHRFATVAACRRQARPPTFKASDVSSGRLPTGELVVLADVLDAERNEAVRAVSADASIIDVASKHLGYVPTGHRARLIWSFVCDATSEIREREGQTVMYHFDVESYNFVYGNYYITSVDARSGAHTMIIGSHDDKPFSWLLGSAKRSDSEIRTHYAAGREIALVGPPGFGFMQDSSCYHRALAPVDRARLMLQVRYF